MARNLYRFYLYTVYIVLFIFIAVVTGWMLNTVLDLTPLRGPFTSAPARQEIVQSVVFVVVAWVIAGALAGLHYWLIRRDIRHDPAAGTSAIRSFFLNFTEAIGMALAVPATGLVISSLGLYQSADVVTAVAFALPTFVLVGLLELERRRTSLSSGGALILQRLHFYGVQIILLIALSYTWFTQFRPLVDGLIFGGRGTLEACHRLGDYTCPTFHLFYLAAGILWFIAFWIGYGWLVRNDSSRILRFILHGISFAYGVGCLLAGIYIGVKLLILPLFKLSASFKDIMGLNPPYDFVSPLTLGILVVSIYHLWLNGAAKRGLINPSVKSLMESAITAIVSAVAFWVGCGTLLYNAFQKLAPIPTAPDAMSWISAIALVVAGLGYIPLEIYQRRRNIVDISSASNPRRGLVLALLGGGILASVIGGVTSLYLWVTALFGSPVDNWQQTAHGGLAAFIIGVVLVGIYLWSALKEGYWSRSSKQSVPSDASSSEALSPDALPLDVPTSDAASSVLSESPAQPATVEDTLDELLAGKIARDEAAARIRVLLNGPGE
ncbi:MAG TPA: hypothetical protein VGL94_16115 [Ktedonobacteraceae bacterium]